MTVEQNMDRVRPGEENGRDPANVCIGNMGQNNGDILLPEGIAHGGGVLDGLELEFSQLNSILICTGAGRQKALLIERQELRCIQGGRCQRKKPESLLAAFNALR